MKKPNLVLIRNNPFCEKPRSSHREMKKPSSKKPFLKPFEALLIWLIFYLLELSSHFNFFPPFSPIKATATQFLATSPPASLLSVDCLVFFRVSRIVSETVRGMFPMDSPLSEACGSSTAPWNFRRPSRLSIG